MQVPLLDLKRQYLTIKTEVDDAIARVLSHTQFILGPEVKQFEESLAAYCESQFAVGCASGTDALLLSLRACDVGPGDEVITSSFSFFATAGAISRLGATPIFVDILPDSYNIDPALIEAKITPRTKVIMPVHLFGQCADMDAISELAKKHNLKIVEDAAQAIGAKYKNKKAGTLGDLGCFSFFPSKNLGAYGDAGAVITDDPEMADKIRMLRVHGSRKKYYHETVGYNSRLDTFQAAILSAKLNHLDQWTNKRREYAKFYSERFSHLPLQTPGEGKDTFHIFHQYTLAVSNRDKLKDFLKQKQIGFDTYYPLPLHQQECYRQLAQSNGSFPMAEKKSAEVISLPIFPELTGAELDYVSDCIIGFYQK
ncbi:MAG: DegT/DnrJ/EryC1/StrS family aminotransferase [candidate division Zixibacteria bacterium]|nr:DegT/DnrJ/EryC1/StrS family aminotransferase [candidate division Zixibacteria bacterium]